MIHQCAYLAYQGQQIELLQPGVEGGQQWVLRDANEMYHPHSILFCPCCGRDFRADTWWQSGGRPQENAILAEARETAEAYARAAESSRRRQESEGDAFLETSNVVLGFGKPK